MSNEILQCEECLKNFKSSDAYMVKYDKDMALCSESCYYKYTEKYIKRNS